MLPNEINLEFSIEPGKALLLLELENFLEKTPPEDSPLRRSKDNRSAPLKIIWDTRKIPKSHSIKERVIFIARKTERFNTHSFLEELLNAGHIVIAQWDCLVLSHHQTDANSKDQIWNKELLSHPLLICVKDSLAAGDLLVQTASEIRLKEWTTVAITGTNGKTSTTQIAAAMLENLSQKSVLRIGTLGIQLAGDEWDNPFPTQPDYPGLLAALRMAEEHYGCRQLVMEATSIGIVEKRLGFWPVQCAAFLNLTQDHLDYHGTMEKYLEAKLDLFRNHLEVGGQVVVNCGDSSWDRVIAAAQGKTRLCIGFGHAHMKDLFFSSAEGVFGGCRFLESSHQISNIDGVKGQWTLWLDKHNSVSQGQYYVPLLGEVQHENIAAAAALMLSLGYPLTQILGICQQLKPIPGRLERVEKTAKAAESAVLIDYAHSPDALEKTLRTCRQLLSNGGQLICVFGCGGDRDPSKRPVMGRIATELADRVWLTSDNPRTEEPQTIIGQIFSGIDKKLVQKVVIQVDRKQAIADAIGKSKENDLVVIAGKGHEDYQIIGTTKYPFSDSTVARQALQSKSNI